MIAELRKFINDTYNSTRYKNALLYLSENAGGLPKFKISETPVFISQNLLNSLKEVSNYIIDEIKKDSFIALTNAAIPAKKRVCGEESHPNFLAIDYAICENEKGELIPRLIELQGFPSVFAYQYFLSEAYASAYEIPKNLTPFFSDLDIDSYIKLFEKTVLGDYSADEVILLEIYPTQQKTEIDFIITQKIIGIKTVCVTQLRAEDKTLYYLLNGKKIIVKRIYNRLILEELTPQQLSEISISLDFDYDIEWATHPNHFYRISKFLMPFLNHRLIPKSYFADQIPSHILDFGNYILKPLFAFAGQGVKLNITVKDIREINDKQDWIIQEKVKYAGAIKMPEEAIKCEIRLMYLWPDENENPTLAINMCRLSNTRFMNVGQNAVHKWVGSSIGFIKTDN